MRFTYLLDQVVEDRRDVAHADGVECEAEDAVELAGLVRGAEARGVRDLREDLQQRWLVWSGLIGEPSDVDRQAATTNTITTYLALDGQPRERNVVFGEVALHGARAVLDLEDGAVLIVCVYDGGGME